MSRFEFAMVGDANTSPPFATICVAAPTDDGDCRLTSVKRIHADSPFTPRELAYNHALFTRPCPPGAPGRMNHRSRITPSAACTLERKAPHVREAAGHCRMCAVV